MKKINLLLMLGFLLGILSGCGGNETGLKNGTVFKILHLNDTHGAIEEQDNEPGMAKIAGYVNKVRKANPNKTIVLSSGDMFQGSLESNATKGKVMIDMMKAMQFDAMTIGNHEFDWGVEALEDNRIYAENEQIGDWSIPFLAGNIVYDGDYVLGDLSTTFTRGEAKISIIGTIDPAVRSSIDAELIEGYEFINPTDMVIAEAQRLREEGSDIIIYSSHYNGGYLLQGIAEYVDCIFTGHRHLGSVQSIIASDDREVPVIESSYNGQQLGEVSFKYQKATDTFVLKDYKNVEDISKTISKGDDEILDIYNHYLDDVPFVDGIVTAESLRKAKTEAIGQITSGSKYAGSSSVSRSNALNLFIDVQLATYQEEDPTLVASSYNAARAELPIGNITYSDIYKAFPFDNTTVIIELTGLQLLSWSTSIRYINGFSKASINSGEIYHLVTCTFVLNNYEVDNYLQITQEFAGVYQRQVLYRAFVEHPNHTPVG